MPPIGDDRFFRDLATKLRAVDQRRTARADAQRDATAAAGGVPLADMLDLLTSDEGADALRTLQAQADQAVAALDDASRRAGAPLFPASGGDAYHPADRFERELAGWFRLKWLTRGGRPLPEVVPQAVVEAFGRVAGDDGMVTEAEAGRLGPGGLRAFALLRGRLEDLGGPPPSDRDAGKVAWLGPVTLRRVGRSRRVAGPKERMPVLDDVSRLLGSPDALRHFKMASVQHLFPSTRGLDDALEGNGLPVNVTGIGGKGYSTDTDTMARLVAEGWDVHPDGAPTAHRSGLDAGHVVEVIARQQLAELFHGVDPDAAGQRRFLLLDEGGKLVKALHLYFPRFAKLCVAVEQTDRGVQIADESEARYQQERGVFEQTGVWPKPRKGYRLRCPVMNMARSEAKKVWESPMIGESCVFNLEAQLDAMHPALREMLFQDPAHKQACVIGYGAVGKAVADRLRARGFDVFVFDKDADKMAQAAADGCQAVARDEALRHGHLTYGCTGRGPIGPDDFELLPDGAVLANAASGNHELGVQDLDLDDAGGDTAQDTDGPAARSRFRGLDVRLGETDDPMRHRVWRTPSGKELLLARSGYVVNMDLDLPPEYAQLTRGLLLASCLLATGASTPGFVDLDEQAQQLVVNRTIRALAAQGLSLEHPDFRELPPWG